VISALKVILAMEQASALGAIHLSIHIEEQSMVNAYYAQLVITVSEVAKDKSAELIISGVLLVTMVTPQLLIQREIHRQNPVIYASLDTSPTEGA
jgi:hypothetical protein